MVSAMGTKLVQLQNIEGSSQAGEFTINKLSLQFTYIYGELSCCSLFGVKKV
jgi:hypothetical protein